jgi:hypothetical protein
MRGGGGGGGGDQTCGTYPGQERVAHDGVHGARTSGGKGGVGEEVVVTCFFQDNA